VEGRPDHPEVESHSGAGRRPIGRSSHTAPIGWWLMPSTWPARAIRMSMPRSRLVAAALCSFATGAALRSRPRSPPRCRRVRPACAGHRGLAESGSGPECGGGRATEGRGEAPSAHPQDGEVGWAGDESPTRGGLDCGHACLHRVAARGTGVLGFPLRCCLDQPAGAGPSSSALCRLERRAEPTTDPLVARARSTASRQLVLPSDLDVLGARCGSNRRRKRTGLEIAPSGRDAMQAVRLRPARVGGGHVSGVWSGRVAPRPFLCPH
jgi:hypothetical protein